MPNSILIANAVMLGLALAGWVLLGVAFLHRPRGAHPARGERLDPASRLGVALGAVGFALVWGVRRPWNEPPFGFPAPYSLVAILLTAGLVALAIWLAWGAFRALGAQWSIRARVLTGHTLITGGPYARVRHPIYASLGAMLIATGLAITQWFALLGGLLAYGIGTAIRIRSEEALLRETFGEAYVEYASRVPAVFPHLRARVVQTRRAHR